MVALWIIIGLLTAAVVAGLLWPLLRDRQGAGDAATVSRAAFDLNVYKDQLDEIERDHERGLLDADQVEAARLEVQRRILAASDSETTSSQPFAKGRTVFAVIAVILVPVCSFAMYGILGSPSVPDFPFASRQMEQDKKQTIAGLSVSELLERLKARLKRQPDNIQGWLLLARTSMRLEQYDQAVAAYRKAIALGNNNPDIAVNYAEALSAASGAVVTDEAYKIFTDAVARNPRDAKSRYYLGLAHAQKGEIKKALQAWVDLRAISAPDAPWRSMIDGQIARAVKELGVDPARVKPSAEIQKLVAETKPQKTISSPPQSTPQSTPQSSPESVAPMRGPTAEDIRAAGEMTAQERAAFIRSMVQRLADRLKENPNDRMGWLRLARAYDVLGEKEKADEARAKAKALKP